MTLLAYCKRTQHFRVFLSRLYMIDSKQWKERSISRSSPSSNAGRRSGLSASRDHNAVRFRFNDDDDDDDDDNQMTSLLPKKLRSGRTCRYWSGGKFGRHLVLQLNEVGRRYLVRAERSSISKGVHVVSAVGDDINGVFLHLLENPKLCARSAVELWPVIGRVIETMEREGNRRVRRFQVESEKQVRLSKRA
jgi:hypothetical protein